MREIEFRGKSVIGNKWVYGWLNATTEEDGEHYWIDKCLCSEDGTDYAYQVDPESVGQYTGLKDRNGKKIFEGNIIMYTNNQNKVYRIGKKMKGFIVFDEYNQCYISKNNFQKDMYWQYAEDVEIIGNIYDNPELLEVEK